MGSTRSASIFRPWRREMGYVWILWWLSIEHLGRVRRLAVKHPLNNLERYAEGAGQRLQSRPWMAMTGCFRTLSNLPAGTGLLKQKAPPNRSMQAPPLPQHLHRSRPTLYSFKPMMCSEYTHAAGRLRSDSEIRQAAAAPSSHNNPLAAASAELVVSLLPSHHGRSKSRGF